MATCRWSSTPQRSNSLRTSAPHAACTETAVCMVMQRRNIAGGCRWVCIGAGAYSSRTGWSPDSLNEFKELDSKSVTDFQPWRRHLSCLQRSTCRALGCQKAAHSSAKEQPCRAAFHNLGLVAKGRPDTRLWLRLKAAAGAAAASTGTTRTRAPAPGSATRERSAMRIFGECVLMIGMIRDPWIAASAASGVVQVRTPRRDIYFPGGEQLGSTCALGYCHRIV